MAAFGPCLKVGEFLFPSGLMAIGPDCHVAGSEVSLAFPALAHAGYSQAGAIMAMPRRCPGLPGTTMGRLLRAHYFLTDIAAFPGIAMAWSSRYGGQPHPFVCVQSYHDDALPYDPEFTPASFSPCPYAHGIRGDVAVLSVSGWMDGVGYQNGAIARFLTLPNRKAVLRRQPA